jgi:predicted RNA-binding protein (virulence factor B family)
VIVHVYLDEKTNRIVATTRLNRHLSRDTPAYRDGQNVNLLLIGRTPLGYNAIVEDAFDDSAIRSFARVRGKSASGQQKRGHETDREH